MTDTEKVGDLSDPDPELDPSVQANATAVKIQKALRNLIITNIVLFVCMVGIAYYIYTVAKANTEALCTVRIDAQARIDQTNKFIEKHPNGWRGISVAELKRGLEGPAHTVQSLSSLNCKVPTKPKAP